MPPPLNRFPPQTEQISPNEVVHPTDMVAFEITQDLIVNIPNPDGSSAKVKIEKGRIGYYVKNHTVQGWFVAQLISPSGYISGILLPRVAALLGARHGFQVNQPRLLFDQHVSIHGLVAKARSNDRLGQAIIRMVMAFGANFDAIKSAGLQSAWIIGPLLQDLRKVSDALTTILGGFSDEAWNAMKDGCDIKKLLALRKVVSSSWPGSRKYQQILYLLLYPRSLHLESDSEDFAKYGGKTTMNPFLRDAGHCSSFHAAQQNKPRHYKVAQGFPFENRGMYPIITMLGASEGVFALAETILCCLCDTWHSDSYLPPLQSDAEWAFLENQRRATIQFLRKIYSRVFESVGFQSLSRTGCNVSLPLSEAKLTRKEWLHYQVTTPDGRGMHVFQTAATRRPARYNTAVSLLNKISLSFSNASPQPPAQGPMILSVEITKDGKPHPTPWYTQPYESAWSNSGELHSFAVFGEWCDESSAQWYSTPLRANIRSMWGQPSSSNGPACNLEWCYATTILQYFNNTCYDSPPPFIKPYIGNNILDVEWRHFLQSVEFQKWKKPTSTVKAPHMVTMEHNYRILFKKLKGNEQICVGAKPTVGDWMCAVTKVLQVRGGSSATRTPFTPIDTRTIPRDEVFNDTTKLPIEDQNRFSETVQTCRVCWGKYRRPCLWVKSSLSPKDLADIVKANPGLIPETDLRVISQQIPSPVSADDYDMLKDETNDQEDADEQDQGDNMDVDV